MRRFVIIIISLFAFFTPIYAQRPITEEDENVTAEIFKKYPNQKVYYHEEYGVYKIEETITPKNSKYSDYSLYRLLDSKGNELFPNCSFTKIYFCSADGLNKNYYPYIEAYLKKTMWALSLDGQWLTMPIKGNVGSFKTTDGKTQIPVREPRNGRSLFRRDSGSSGRQRSWILPWDRQGSYTSGAVLRSPSVPSSPSGK